nr:unnamed protein product [Digitaria exilis]
MGERDVLPPLPLSLAPPHLIPPAPTRDPRAIAFLPDLGGLSWVAYAAGSFLVVSHLPSPSRSDTNDGCCSPCFRQVIDLRAPVSAAAWCGGGSGEVAAAAGNSVSIFQPAPAASSPGSFGWLLRWSITETFPITAVAWTVSGDGIVAVGDGVSMWARAESSWQIAWRSMPNVPQSLVSTTRFMQGPVATAAVIAPAEHSVPVLVFRNDAKRGLEQAELVHPQPVCMIQWRPCSLSVSDRSEFRREILMTCCLDGTVRLWSEDELVKSKKQRSLQISFNAIAVIEVNNTLNGVLGVDITVRWSMESGSVVSRDEEGHFELFSGDLRESQVGEWKRANAALQHLIQSMKACMNTTTSVSQKSEIVELLDKNFSIYGITGTERTQILAISDLVVEITDPSRSSPYKSLDEAGRRFWVAVQFRQLHALRRSGYSSISDGFHVDSASIAWAFQSDCQDDLLNSVLPLEPTWPEMQKLGIGLWYTNVSQLRTRMEKLARLQYLKRKDPKDCALLYIALNRIKVLEERHKAAALKNAYVLMGRHQWELAIAFFLLGDDFSSAVNVCAKNLQDEQLALVICRLVEGSGGPLERNLISNVLLPDATEKGDNWLSSLLEWMLGNYCQSIGRLVGCHPKLPIDESKILGDPYVISDPEVGQYCAILSAKNGLRNCVGEAVSAKLSKLSFAMAAYALNKCGLPLEALECLSTNSGIDGKESINSPDDGDHKIFDGMLNPASPSKNWLSSSVISDIESNLKVTMASKYLSRLLRNHLFCSQCNASLSEDKVLNEYNSHQIEELTCDLTAVISIFDRRF